MKYILIKDSVGLVETDLTGNELISHAKKFDSGVDNLELAIITLKLNGYKVFVQEGSKMEYAKGGSISGFDERVSNKIQEIIDYLEERFGGKVTFSRLSGSMNTNGYVRFKKRGDGEFFPFNTSDRERKQIHDEVKSKTGFHTLGDNKTMDIKMFKGRYAEGGKTDSNLLMVKNQAKELLHHSNELISVLKKNPHVEAWVVAKIERATTDLSDVTHYLDGMFAKGGIMHQFTFKRGGHVEIVNADEVYDKSKYDAIFGDYDNDGVTNVDDTEPLNPSKKSNVEALKFADSFEYLLGVKNQLDDIMEDSIEVLKNNSPETADIYARTKTPYSILKKLIYKRMLDPKKGLTDMVGTTIAVDNFKQLQDVKNQIQDGVLGDVIDFDDFYANPNAGYMAYHFIVRVKGVPVEVQLKTKRMKKLNMISHEFYKDGTLNAEGLERLTNLVVKADKGDKEAIREYNELMKNKSKIQSMISTN